MERAIFSNNTTPLKSASTPLQPNTAARLLSVEPSDNFESPALSIHKGTHTTLSPPPPLSYVSVTTNYQACELASTTPTCLVDEHTPKYAAKTTKSCTVATVPPLHAESLNISSIASGNPSPLSMWSNKTEKHQGPSDGQQSQARRLSTDTVGSGDYPSPQSAGLMALLLLQKHSPMSSTANTPKDRDGSGNTSASPCADDALPPECTSAIPPSPCVSRCARVSLNLDGAFFAAQGTEGEERVSGQPSLSTPANVPQTPERVADAPDLSPCTVASTSVGDAVTPVSTTWKGSVWLCDVSREEDDNENEGTPQGKKSCTNASATNIADADGDHSVAASEVLGSFDGSGSRSVFPHTTEAYVSPYPSAAPYSSANVSTSLSPTHTRASPLDRDFGAHYPLFQPRVHSPQQAGLGVPIAQATPSHTELLTNVFAENGTTAALPNFVGPSQVVDDEGTCPLSFQRSPDTQSIRPTHPHDRTGIATDAPLQSPQASPSRASHNRLQPCFSSSGEQDMDTQVFRSGAHVLSPILQHHHILPSRVPWGGESSASHLKFIHAHFCSLPSSPMRRPREDAAIAPRTLLEDTTSSLRSLADTTGHSSLHTPRNVSAVAGGSNSPSMASSPLLASLDASCEARSLPMCGAAAPAAMAGVVQRADTPKSPHTPLDRRTPGPNGLHGGSYASLSEYSYGVSQHRHLPQQLSQPLTPQKSTRRNYSRQTTPSQSFRSKVQSHSFESQQPSHVLQQQQQAQFFGANTSELWTVGGQANASAGSFALGEATTVVAAERDYLAPSRNPFSLYRSLEVCTNPLLRPESVTTAQEEHVEDSASSDATIKVHSASRQPLTEKQTRVVEDLMTAMLRPDAAVVLYEQLIPAPAHAPGSQRTRAKETTPSHAALDLLMHTRPPLHTATPGSLSLSMSGQAWSTAVTAAAAAAADHSSKRTATDGVGVRAAVATPTHARSASNAQDVGMTVAHKESYSRSVSNRTVAAPVPRPCVTLAKCSPLHAPSGSPQRTPLRTMERPGRTPATDSTAGVPLAVPHHPATVCSPSATRPASSASAALLCDTPQGHDRGSSLASSLSTAAARSLSRAFSSPDKADASRPPPPNWNDSAANEDAEEEDISPPPRRPTTQFSPYNVHTRDSVTNSPVCPDRQLNFANDVTDGEEEEDEEKVKGDIAGVSEDLRGLPSPIILETPLVDAGNNTSTTIGSSMGSPDLLRHTVAHVNPTPDGLCSPLQLQLNLHDALRGRLDREREKDKHTTTLRPPAAAYQDPLEKPPHLLQSLQLPQPHHQSCQQQKQQRQYTPSRDLPGLRLSMDSNWTHGAAPGAKRVLSNNLACSGYEGASILSPSGYQALSSALDPLEMTETSEEEIPGDRFQAHHEFQFLHYVDAVVEASSKAFGGTATSATTTTSLASRNAGIALGRPIPLSAEVNGVTWLATHRLSGLPYAVKEVPAAAFNTAELRCLTLSNSRPHSPSGTTQLGGVQSLALEDVLEAEDYLARYFSVTTPPQESSKPTVHLLQLEYFPRGSLHDVIRQRSVSPSLNCDFWEEVVQQGLRGLRVLHRARLVHGSPLPCCLFFTGHTSGLLRVKWSCFGNARASADVYPTESLPSWLGEAVRLLYRQYDGAGTVPVEAIEVAVFCLGVLEVLVEDAQESDEANGLAAPTHTAATDGLCHLERMEAVVRRYDGQHNLLSKDKVELHAFMKFLWNSANSYLGADAMLAQMGVRIDPALLTVEELYHYEIDRLKRQLQERQKLKRETAMDATPLFGSHHERTVSSHSQNSTEPSQCPQRATERTPSATYMGSGQGLQPCALNVAVGPGSAHAMCSQPSPETHWVSSGTRGSPQLFPRRTSVSNVRLPRAALHSILADEQLAFNNNTSAGAAGDGSTLLLPSSTAAMSPIARPTTATAVGSNAEASASMLSLRTDWPTSVVSPRGATTVRRGRSDVHPQVRAAAHAMLTKAILPPSHAKPLSPPDVWRALLHPAVHSLRLRGWSTLYSGIPLPRTGMSKVDGRGEEEEELYAQLASLRPMTSFE